MPYRRLSPLFILILALFLAACQPPQPSAPAPTPAASATIQPEADPEPGTPSPEPSLEPSLEPSPEADPEPSNQATAVLPGDAQLVIYSGRNENLVGPLLEDFEKETGIEVAVRYGETAEMAATILEEGDNSPADVFFAQDAGALGALSAAGQLQKLSDEILNQVDARYRSTQGDWVGASGRARVVVYNTNMLKESDLPNDIWGFTDPKWKSKLGWAPTNGSFQAFITALRLLEGEDKAREWLQAMIANDIKEFPSNAPIVAAVGKGEIEAGFVNHYYLLRAAAEQGDQFPARNHYLTAGDAGSMINVAGAGILKTSKHQVAAEKFVHFLLSQEAQTYFAQQTDEYPLIAGVPTASGKAASLLKPLAEIKAPTIDLNNLSDLQGTLQLLQDVGALN